MLAARSFCLQAALPRRRPFHYIHPKPPPRQRGLGLEPGGGSARVAIDGGPPESHADDPIRAALDRVVALGNDDPAGDEELFVRGLRRLVASLVS